MTNLVKRLKNLWEMSEYVPLEKDAKGQIGDFITPIVKSNKMAQIIRKKVDIIDEINGN